MLWSAPGHGRETGESPRRLQLRLGLDLGTVNWLGRPAAVWPRLGKILRPVRDGAVHHQELRQQHRKPPDQAGRPSCLGRAKVLEMLMKLDVVICLRGVLLLKDNRAAADGKDDQTCADERVDGANNEGEFVARFVR